MFWQCEQMMSQNRCCNQVSQIKHTVYIVLHIHYTFSKIDHLSCMHSVRQEEYAIQNIHRVGVLNVSYLIRKKLDFQCFVIFVLQSIITVLLESLCREFPPLVQPRCNKMVEKYVQLLVDMLLNNTSPNFICTLLNLCEIRERPINGQSPDFGFQF